MQITKTDAAWNLAATGLRVASGIVILPLLLYHLSQEEIALWTIFLSFGAMVALLDFGFSATFTRNITYIFSGARELKVEGYVEVGETQDTDYSLLKGMIRAMNIFYGSLSLFFLLLLLTAGTFYLQHILQTYNGNRNAVFTAWWLYAIIIALQLYTLLYDVLLMGRGEIRRSKQIVVLAQLVQIIISATALTMNCGIISMAYGQLAGMIVNRVLAHRTFYNKPLRVHLKNSALSHSTPEILKIIFPNALKVGLTALGAFLTARAGIFIASLYLPLSDIASYGITQQVIDILVAISVVWLTTFYPRITRFRIIGDLDGVKRLYLKSKIFSVLVYLSGACLLLLWGNDLLTVMHSKTLFLPTTIFAIGLAAYFIENLYVLAVYMLLSKNEVPYYKASLTAGFVNILLLFIFVHFTPVRVAGIFLARGIAQLYNCWRWPHEVRKELSISSTDYKQTMIEFYKTLYG